MSESNLPGSRGEGFLRFLQNVFDLGMTGSSRTKSPQAIAGIAFVAILGALLAGMACSAIFYSSAGHGSRVFFALFALLNAAVSCAYLLKLVGALVRANRSEKIHELDVVSGLNFFRGFVQEGERRCQGPVALELALQQLVQQVRSYAVEKNYQKSRVGERQQPVVGVRAIESTDLLARRWNEVIDTANELELFLSNDPASVLLKAMTQPVTINLDVSQIFREVSESFDNTWRARGINIESAIVTPLRATTNEIVLRRLLVGPWRAAVWFAKRGRGVVFSAKSQGGRVVACWECNELVVPEEYLVTAQNSSLSLNDRIEQGLVAVAGDINSPHIFHALVSLITWIEQAKFCKADFHFKNTNQGFVIELRL